jgi:hypothetical protein
MVMQLTERQAAVSSTAQSMLGHLLGEAFCVEVVDDMFTEFWEQVEWRSRFKNSGTRVCDLILEPPLGQVWLADRLVEVIGRLREEQAERWEADVELEGLWNSTAWVRDLVLGDL